MNFCEYLKLHNLKVCVFKSYIRVWVRVKVRFRLKVWLRVRVRDRVSEFGW